MKTRSEVGYLVLISLSLTVVLAVCNDVHSLRKALSNNLCAINEQHKSDFSVSPALADCFKTFHSKEQINDILLLDIIKQSPVPVFPIIFTLPEVVKSFISQYESNTDNDFNICFNSNRLFEISVSEYTKVLNTNTVSVFSGFLPKEQPVRAGPVFTPHFI